jgi:hypothetical protein
MDTNRKATPTEYKGIVYRSKSEAMFARYLELEASELDGAFGMRYEPLTRDIQNNLGIEWNPDFVTWRVVWSTSGVPILYTRLIEYKPCKPTRTYLKTLQQNFAASELDVGNCFLYYGSVYSKDRGKYVIFPEGWLEHGEQDWLRRFEKQVSETRFDLAQA